jgi:hypothetical protein
MPGTVQALCEAVRDLLRTANGQSLLRHNGVDLADIEASPPRPPLLGQFPKAFVTWVSRETESRQVCAPSLSYVFRYSCQVRLYVSDISQVFRIESTRELVDAVDAVLGCQRTLGAACTDMEVTRTSGDAEALFNRGVIAHGLVEFWALVAETRTLTD